MESFLEPKIFGSQGILRMNTYVKRLLIVMSISSMYLSHAAETAYHIAHLDPVRIASKQQAFDKKYMRSKYLRYAGMSLVAGWMVYSGYKYFTKLPATAPTSSVSDDQTGLTRKVETLQQEVDHLKQNMEMVKGNNWLAWGSDLMHHAIWALS